MCSSDLSSTQSPQIAPVDLASSGMGRGIRVKGHGRGDGRRTRPGCTPFRANAQGRRRRSTFDGKVGSPTRPGSRIGHRDTEAQSKPRAVWHAVTPRRQGRRSRMGFYRGAAHLDKSPLVPADRRISGWRSTRATRIGIIAIGCSRGRPLPQIGRAHV